MENEYEIGVYGHSDDLVEVVGDVQEEFPADFNGPTHLIIGNTEVCVEYTLEGVWEVSDVNPGATDVIRHHSVGSSELAEKTNDYTEAIVVETDELHAKKIE